MRTDVDDSAAIDGAWMQSLGAVSPWPGAWRLHVQQLGLEFWWSEEAPEAFGLYTLSDTDLLAEVKATRGNLRRLCLLFGTPLKEPSPRR